MNRVRIPSLALVTLTFGGACGDDDDGGGGIDTSASRMASIARESCDQYYACYGDEEEASDETRAECERNYVEAFETYEAMVTDDCLDAMLDYFECYASLSCDDIGSEDTIARKCKAEAQMSRCEGQLQEPS